jgi:hypothetical protein
MTIRRILWALAALGSVIGALEFLLTNMTATGAPQQAAGSAMAVAWAVLPYVFARAADEFIRP